MLSFFNSRAKSGVAVILQFIEQVLRIDTFQLTVLHLTELTKGMVNLGKSLLLGGCFGLHHISLTVRPAHLGNHLLEEADFMVGDVDGNCGHIIIVLSSVCKDTIKRGQNKEFFSFFVER